MEKEWKAVLPSYKIITEGPTPWSCNNWECSELDIIITERESSKSTYICPSHWGYVWLEGNRLISYKVKAEPPPGMDFSDFYEYRNNLPDLSKRKENK